MPQLSCGAAFDAAILAVADAVEACGIRDGERLEHDGVNEREDGCRGTDAEGQGEHGGKGKYGRLPHLAESVGDVLAQGLHREPHRLLRRKAERCSREKCC